MSSLETMTVLVLSTAHVTLAEAEAFDAGKYPEQFPSLFKGDYGWILYVPTKGEQSEEDKFWDGVSDGLKGAMQLCQSEGLNWLRLDSDGAVADGIPSYSW
jgi:hypothetical protein